MSTNSERILGPDGPLSRRSWPLHDSAQTRALETSHPPGADGQTLMQIAGLALARLALALFPHAQSIWVACGPGNNGGDGLEAAAHLQRWGKQVLVSLLHEPQHSPIDARQAWAAAQHAGVQFAATAPAQFDACIDALFGIGAVRPLGPVYSAWVAHMNAALAPTLAVDVPSGLQADTGVTSPVQVKADFTLSLLTLKPGLFTGSGRDACGEIWFNDLGVTAPGPAHALLLGQPKQTARSHASHKGSYGDVCVVGGAPGMTGAALLAARSALFGGAGRVFVCPLGPAELTLDLQYPELMLRNFDTLDWSAMVLVAGCGGGDAIASYLPRILRDAKQLVLDADALNQIAQSPQLQQQLATRLTGSTVISPHPLEAARLLGSTTATIQADRLGAAHALAERYHCVVVLKGSGSVIAAPGAIPRINPTGNASLATAGTGDVLAGLLGAKLAAGLPALDAACAAVYQHGLAANEWNAPEQAQAQGQRQVLSAAALCQWR